MRNSAANDAIVSGLGVLTAIGQGKQSFGDALLAGRHAFAVMRREGRQKDSSFIGAELAPLAGLDQLPAKLRRTTSLSAQAALLAAAEAWREAQLDQVDARRIGLVIGGSNVQQRELVLLQQTYAERIQYLRPSYALSFWDSDICGVCTEHLGIRGGSHTVGGASASGHLAIFQAIQAVQSGQVDVCIALGALTDLSYWELHAFRSLGALGSERFAHAPESACRPFDRHSDGFIFGESCGAVVVERAKHARQRGMAAYARLSGWAAVMDAHRNPDPSYEGEVEVIRSALSHASIAAADVDYINPHGTGSVLGDATEVRAIVDCGLEHARINATKSLVGHGLAAAGIVEVIASLLQMKSSRLHPTRNLTDPIDERCNWVQDTAVTHRITHALNLSMGFGGINTALCLSACE